MTRQLTRLRRNGGRWRYQNIEKVKYLVAQGYTDNSELAPFFGVDSGTIGAWRKRYSLFDQAIVSTVSDISANAIKLVAEDIETGNVETAKWWLTKMAKGFQQKPDLSAGGDLNVQIINYGKHDNATE